MFYKTCPDCRANLDPNEVCDCTKKETVLQQQKQSPNKISIISLTAAKREVKPVRGCLNG